MASDRAGERPAGRRPGARTAAQGPPPTRAERRAGRAEVDDPAVVLDAAARLLEARPRAVAEVRGRLLNAGYRPALVEATVERLLAAGYLDDTAFATSWVESRDRAHPRGETVLRRELLHKGVERYVVDDVLAARRGEGRGDALSAMGFLDASAAGAPSPDEAAAERLLARRGATLARVADPRLRRQRAYALLARNGFDPDVCRTVAARQTMLASDAPDGAGEPDGGPNSL